jgi:hypothetical protein
MRGNEQGNCCWRKPTKVRRATYVSLTIAQVIADFQAVLKLEPSNKEIQKELKRQKVVCH